MRYGLISILTLAVAGAQTVQPGEFAGREAWILENGVMRVAVLRGGGHIAEVRLISTDPRASVNPMRVPHYPTIEPHRYEDAKHNATYGTDPHRWLSAGYMGHLLCFPSYGPPSSDAEIAAGLGNHGEAPVVEWKELGIERGRDQVTLRYGADLPKTQYRVERAVHLRRGERQVRVEEWVENLTNYDRPFQWMQHATFGPPFIEPGVTLLDASVTRAMQAGQPEFRWDADPARRVMTGTKGTGSYTAMRTDPGRAEQFFTLTHPRYRVLIGYLFPAAQNPWLADWQENQRATHRPWNGQVIARGLEFGNSPFAEGLRKAVERASLFDTPSHGWIGARQRLRTEFTVFLEPVAEGFAGVSDVRRREGRIELVPRGR